MAPIKSNKKEAIRLQEAKSVIKKMKQRRREQKKVERKVSPSAVKALVSGSLSSTNWNGSPHESLVTLRSKPTMNQSKKSTSNVQSDVVIKNEFQSPDVGGPSQNGKRSDRKSEKPLSPKNRDRKRGMSLYDSPASFFPDPPLPSMLSTPGMSFGFDMEESPFIRPSGVTRTYANKKRMESTSSNPLPFPPSLDSTFVLGSTCANKKRLESTSSNLLPFPDSPIPNSPNEVFDIIEPNNDDEMVQHAAPCKRKKKSMKSLKISRNTVKVKKVTAPMSTPMSIKKTSTTVKVPAFSVTSGNIPTRNEPKTADFYKKKQIGTVKSGFRVTTVSENKLPLNNESSDDGETQADEKVMSNDEVELSSSGSGNEYEDIVEEPTSKEPLYNSGTQFHLIDGHVILHLKHPSTFTFCGQIIVKVLKGTVEVLGYLLNPSKGYHTVFSPHGSGLLALQTLPSKEDQTEIVTDQEFSGLSLLKEGMPGDIFLLLKKSESILPFFVSQFMDFNLFSTNYDTSGEDSLSKASRKLQCLFGPSEEDNVVQKGDLWDEISQNMNEHPGCTVLCGGKGVGKSTLLRFLVNTLLNKGTDNPVIVMDFDPGQPELTVPGCVSLSIVRTPLLGPNFTHLQSPHKCVYIGDINVSNCVSRYMDACLTIISYWQSDEELSKMPCIVNTMGFTRGIGITIMVQLLSALQPSQVVQILSNVPTLDYPEVMSVEYVKKSCSNSPFTINLDSTMNTQRHNLFSRGSLNYALHVINSASPFGKELSNFKGFDARRRREAVLVSYFSQMVSAPNYSILDVVPMCCRLDSLYLHICHESVPPEVTLAAFNASLVALCCVDPAKEDVAYLPDSGFPSIITKRLAADCLGFGIVRGIDMETRLLYLLTPVSTNVLDSVNCLILGAVNLPSSIYFSPPKEPGAVPYVIESIDRKSFQGNSKCMSFRGD